MFGRNKPMQATRTKVDFSYSHDLRATHPFTSDWVADVWYAERAQELLLKTHSGNSYLYNRVPRFDYNGLVDAAKRGYSVGEYVNSIKHRFGPALHTSEEYEFTPVPLVPLTAKVDLTDVTAAPKDANMVDGKPLPPVYETVIDYLLDGKAVTMRSTKPAEQALNDYLTAVDLMGLNAELQSMTLSFVKPDPI